MVGITIASMIPSELNRICRSAEAMGPFGSSTPSLQPPSSAALIRMKARRRGRMSDVPRRDFEKGARRVVGARQTRGLRWSDRAECGAREHGGWGAAIAVTAQHRGEQHEQ